MNRLSAAILALIGAAVLVSATALPALAVSDPNDPYQSGCSRNSYAANHGDVIDQSTGQVMAHFENWYSRSCNKNWGLIWWNGVGSQKIITSQIDVHTQGHADDPVGIHHQCFPTSCNPDEFNTNGLSPTWTDMIEGTDRACLNGWVANAHFGTRLSGQFTGTPDNICA